MGVRIQELPETTGINKEDLLIVEDGQGTKKGTVQQLDEALGVSQLKEDLVDISEDVSQMITYEQTEQEFKASGNLISDNWDSTGVGGYYDGNGNYVENPSYRWFRMNGVRNEYEFYTYNLTGVCFIHVFSGEPSSSTFVRRYSSTDSSLPTESNKAVVPSNYIVIVGNTSSSSIKIKANNKVVIKYGEKLSEIENMANSSKEVADSANEKANNALNISEDVSQMITYEQTEQEFKASGNLISDNWDSTGVGGYYDGNGNYVENPSYRWFRMNGVRNEYEFYTYNLTGVCFIHVFSGEPSSSTFVRRYSSTDSSLPTESNKAVVPSNYIVIVGNTSSSSIKIKANNKVVIKYGEKLSEIENMANSSKEVADSANEKANNALNISETIAPKVEKSNELIITQDQCEYLGNYIVGSDGALTENTSYFAYKYTIPHNGRWHMNNLGYSSYGFLGVYNGEPSPSTFNQEIGRKLGSDTSSWDFNLSTGDVVVLSVNKVSSINFKMYFEYSMEVRPTLFMHNMKIAWFGDSISQLQLLPHRIAEYIGCVVEDCSFAGAPLTYGAEAYQGTGFMSLSSQIISGDFSELENALSKQTSVTDDKRANADRLEALNFNTITDIVVMAGTHDLNNDYVTTSTDLTKFKNGMRTAIENILDNFPHICMRFISNPYRGDITVDRHGNSLADFVNAEKEVCEEYNIPYYDLLHKCGINSHNVGYYLMNDKLHQNENGDILLAQKCAKWLMSN